MDQSVNWTPINQWFPPGQGRGWGGGGGYFIKFSIPGLNTNKNWTQSDLNFLRFCENEGSKRFKITEKAGQFIKNKGKIYTKCLKSVKKKTFW